MSDGDVIRRWREQPQRMVRELFGAEPEAWQDEALGAFPTSQRLCFKASKGVGKTACEAWIIWNFLLTRPHPKIAAAAISGANLADNLWSELALWMNKSEWLRERFVWTKTRIFAKAHPETWWCSARSWSQSADKSQQANTLAGLHADYIMFILDESGGMPEAIMAAAEAALSSCKEGHIVQAGNPTHLEGPLYKACTSEKRLWRIVDINGDPDNPKRASRVSIDWAREQIEKYGRENPWVLINVFGQFPPSSINTLIGPDEMAAAEKRVYQESDIAHAARILGVDVARFGDDASVIFPRQGLMAFTPQLLRNADSLQGAGVVARKWQDWEADACFIDDTGGYGAGWIDALRSLGRAPIGVSFSGQPNDKRYFNKRAEMYFECVEWIKGGGKLPPCPELVAALTQTTYTFKGDRLLLEDKQQIKERIGYSPDHADALVATFAQPIAPRVKSQGRATAQAVVDYHPHAQWHRDPTGTNYGARTTQSYDPAARWR